MKKKDIILIVGVVLIIAIALFATKGTHAANTSLPLRLSGEEKGLIKIDYLTYESKISNNENFIIIIERTGCGYCEKYMPITEEVANELGLPIYYIDTADLSTEDFGKLSESNRYLKTRKWGTPTTLLMSGSTVLDSIGEYVEKDEVVKFINKDILLNEE